MTRRKPKRTRSFTQSQGPSHHQNPNIMSEADPDQSDSLQSQDPEPDEENQQQQQQQQEPPIQQLEMEMEVEEQGGEEEEEEEESQGTAISPPRLLPSAHDRNPAPPPPPPPLPIAPRRGGTKKRKKPTRRKRDAVEKKLRLLRQNLLPVPFVPVKTLDLTKHENLLKTLGLWDFAHLELDQFIRSDLLASLIANYDPVARCSYVKDQRINVSRPSLGRALNLPIKKDKAAAALVEFPDPDRDGFAEEAIAVVSEFMSTYMLLHEDTWMMPEEILASERLVKEGQPQKVDWARLIWFMVEKELTQAPDSGSCYYASHLQCLMKSQKPDIFKEIEVEEVSPEEDEDAAAAAAAERSVALDAVKDRDSQKPGIELSLGQEKNEAEHVEEDSVMDFPECREEPGQWFLNERSIGIEHTLQHCSQPVLENSEGEQMDKDAEEEQYDLSMKFHKLEGVPSGGLMQGMETGNVSYGMPVNLIDPSSSEILMSRGDMNRSIPLNHNDLSMFGNAYKEEISDEDAVPHITHNDQHRKMNGAGGWDRTPEGFVVCMEQVQSWLNKARVIHEEKEEGYLRLQMNLDYLVAQLSERDGIINSLERSVLEERNKKQVEIYRLEHEHCIMTQLLHGYRKALKETNTAFAEYRERFQQPVEPIYKDVGGNGGDVLSVMELEKLRLKKEEEEGKMRSEIEEKIKAFEHDWLGKFDLHLKKVDLFDKRLLNIAKEGELLKENSKTKRLST